MHPSRPLYEYHPVKTLPDEWCPHCALSSVIVMEYVLVAKLDPTKWLGRLAVAWCADCGATDYS
jgi:hypothetical protein